MGPKWNSKNKKKGIRTRLDHMGLLMYSHSVVMVFKRNIVLHLNIHYSSKMVKKVRFLIGISFSFFSR